MNKTVNKCNFIACDKPYDEADLVIFGAPFDGTTSYRPGTRFGPHAIRSDSEACIETYSPYFDRDIADLNLCDIGDVELPIGNAERCLKEISATTQEILNDNKKFIMLGGEHLVTLATVREVYKKHPDLFLLHFDAHTDLREDYLGVQLSHAAVIRRCWEFMGDKNIASFGIRSGEKSEWTWAREHIYFCPFDFSALEKTIELVGTRPCYITFDLDVIDPAELPGTGTPEAGGMSFKDISQALLKLQKLNIVAADINELAPNLDPSGRSTAFAIKLLREFILAIM